MTEPQRLLVVDDEPTILFAMAEYLRSAGYRVDVAAEKEEAQALLDNRKYGAVIADLRLFGSESRDGLEVIASARACSRETRIVLLSAFAFGDVEAEAHRTGADAVLRKPQPLSAVAATVRRLLSEAP